MSVEKLTHLGEKTLKTNPGPPGWGVGHRASNPIRVGWSYEISVKYSQLDIKKKKTGKRQLRIEELGETWMRR